MHQSTDKYQKRAKRNLWRNTALLLFTLCALNISFADNRSEGTILVHGNIEGSTKDKKTKIEIDLDMLRALEKTTFTTSAPWTDEPTEYTGVRINTLLKSIGALSTSFKAMAGNNYQFLLSDIDFDKYPIIIAYKKNGEILNTRTLGPFLIMFPFDDFPELLNEKNKAASVWQLTELEIL